MIPAPVFARATRDRMAGFAVGAVTIAITLWAAMLVYRQIDISFYFELGDAALDLLGIPKGGDVAGLAYGVIYGLLGALTVAGLATAMGAGEIAGEENRGTLGLLLANPLSRSGALAAKVLALILLVVLSVGILWLAGLVVPAGLGVDMTGIHVGAVILHLAANSIFYGTLAFAIGAWTGRASTASSVTVAVMLIGYLGSGLLPLIQDLDWLARIFPWYYFNGSQPVVNGIDWAHIAVLVASSFLLFAVAWVGLNRRDLRERSVAVTLTDRLRAYPLTRRLAERVAGSARVSRIALKTASDHQGLLVITAAVMFYMGIIIGPLYSLIPDSFTEALASFPDFVLAMVGGTDLSTPAGFYQAEVFSLVGPATFAALTAIAGSRALAGEERDRTMGLLLANPVSRERVVLEKTAAMVGLVVALVVATFLGTWIGALLGGLDLSAGNILAIAGLLGLFGLFLGGVSLLASAATGRTRIAGYATAGVLLVSYFGFVFLPLADATAGLARWSPFYWYLGGDPLMNGMDWGHAALLLAGFVGLVGLSIVSWQRRDLKD